MTRPQFTQSMITARMAERFYRWVSAPSEDACWEWQGSCFPNGYGQFGIYIDGKQWQFKAHRFAYTLLIGDILDDMLVCHHCDNRRCCNPQHLFLGTQTDNIRDLHSKHRGHYGSDHHRSKLNYDQVQEIRAACIPGDREFGYGALAVKYGVSRPTIRGVVQGVYWKHVA